MIHFWFTHSIWVFSLSVYLSYLIQTYLTILSTWSHCLDLFSFDEVCIKSQHVISKCCWRLKMIVKSIEYVTERNWEFYLWIVVEISLCQTLWSSNQDFLDCFIDELIILQARITVIFSAETHNCGWAGWNAKILQKKFRQEHIKWSWSLCILCDASIWR